MARHNDGLVVHTPEVPSGCRDHPGEAAAVEVVDKWIEAIEPGVARVKYVGPNEPYRDVAIRISRTIIFKKDFLVVQVETRSVLKNICWKSTVG
jgi:hypothetical protein